jgi:FkbM family methyltransferase
MKVLLATPCYTGKTVIGFTAALAKTFKNTRGHEIEFIFTRGDALVQKSRNYFVAYALYHGADVLIMIDDDIEWRPEWIYTLLAYEQDVVSGMYPKKTDTEEYPFVPIMNSGEWFPPEIDTRTGLVRVAGVPTGFLKLSRRAMEVLWNASPAYKNGLMPEERAIFDLAIIDGTLFSEDYIMCQRLFQAGVPVWVDPRMTCNHTGPKTYTGMFAKWLENQRKEHFWPTLWTELKGQVPALPEYAQYTAYWKPHWDFLKQSRDQGFCPKIAYDIGACYGEWSAMIKNLWPECRVYAFEAQRDKVPFLVEHADEHHIDVLSDEDGRDVRFYYNIELPGGNSYYLEQTPNFSEDRYDVRTTRTIDSVVKERGWPAPDLVKVDVQGAEMDVLKGARATLGPASHMIVEIQHTDYNKGAVKADEAIPWIEHTLGFTCLGPFHERGCDKDYAFVKKK